MRLPLIIALAFALWAPPAVADCAVVFSLFCDSPYVVAEVQSVVDKRTRLTVVEAYGDDAPRVGEVLMLNASDTDRRGELIVVSEGFRMGRLVDGKFNHFGALLTIEQLEALRAEPDTCAAELVKLGGAHPPCDDNLFGCTSAGAMTALALIPLWFGRRRRRG